MRANDKLTYLCSIALRCQTDLTLSTKSDDYDGVEPFFPTTLEIIKKQS